jgi:hypothetical protein
MHAAKHLPFGLWKKAGPCVLAAWVPALGFDRIMTQARSPLLPCTQAARASTTNKGYAPQCG